MSNIYLAVWDALQIGKQIFRIKKNFGRCLLCGTDIAFAFSHGAYLACGGCKLKGWRHISADKSGAGWKTVYVL